MNGHLRKSNPQIEMFGVTPQRRERKPESFELYVAVLVMRARGHRVIRGGFGSHLVDGKRTYSQKQFLQLARAKR